MGYLPYADYSLPVNNRRQVVDLVQPPGSFQDSTGQAFLNPIIEGDGQTT
jgi:hypothetical protein